MSWPVRIVLILLAALILEYVIAAFIIEKTWSKGKRCPRPLSHALSWLGDKIALVVTPVVLFLVYFIVFGIASVILRLFMPDMLQKRRKADPDASYWKKKEDFDTSPERLKRSF